MLYYMQKENGYKQEVDDDSKKLWVVMLSSVSIMVTLIGLGFSVYNYYVFDKPFMTTTTKRITGSIFPVCDNCCH